MTTDYTAVREDNQLEYGAGVGRWGQDLLTNRYDDRAHFIFELLQNAEDALARRPGWKGSRAVTFTLSETALRIAHCGKPFDTGDVRGICGIAESTKDLTAIGRFGIGFKSVYAFTRRPEVHSGEEDFAVESFVLPTAISATDRQADETVFILPLEPANVTAHTEIVEGLRRLGPRALLFLRQIEEIAWSVDDGPSGLYVRGNPEHVGDNGRRIVVLGEEHGKKDVEETWLVFSREVRNPGGDVAGHVEVAFAIRGGVPSGWAVQSITDSRLVVFFPTVLPTYLGFLAQGPYRTTPSRDNVPRDDPWNQHLARETSTLLVEALCSLRDQGLLKVEALCSLPLDRAKFEEDSMFAPLFAAVREALRTESLLPASGASHVAANRVKLARTQELRELFSPSQLAKIFSSDGDTFWLSGEISHDRTPLLRQYLMNELAIAEVTPETIISKLDRAFLSAQSDDWIVTLYEFLNSHPALLRQGRLGDLPLIRLGDGTHVVAELNGEPQAFLPVVAETSFPTVRRAACATEEARALLRKLGLTEPDPVDDVVRNVLHRYRDNEVRIGDDNYGADIGRIVRAFATDSKAQREKLIGALHETAFVMAMNTVGGSKCISKPGDVYLATERLKELFAGVEDILLVDDSYACLRGDDVRDLLEACGATRYLQPVLIVSTFTPKQLRDMRIGAGCESVSTDGPVEDHTLRGLDNLLTLLPMLDGPARAKKAELLWKALADVQDRRGGGTFSGTYRWTYYHRRSATFDAAFVRRLNAVAWVPDAVGELQHPNAVVFDTLGWSPNPILLSHIRFKPPIIDQLAREAGIEPGVLDLLKKLGLTSEADLRDRIALKDGQEEKEDESGNGVNSALKQLPEDAPASTPPVPDLAEGERLESESKSGGRGSGYGARSGSGQRVDSGEPSDDQGSGRGESTAAGSANRSPEASSGRPFISYVAARPQEEDPDPDGLDQAVRMALEARAINLILAREPTWQRTPTNNPGYDLFMPSGDATNLRLCEVKAMTGSLRDRPVGLSHTQFECAREHGGAYWLYVVERAGTTGARILRIQDPASKTRTFTFDHGWLDVALEDPGQANQEE